MGPKAVPARCLVPGPPAPGRPFYPCWNLSGKPEDEYDGGKRGRTMIELTEQQRQVLSAPEPMAIDPQTQETYVLVKKADYERLKELLAKDIALHVVGPHLMAVFERLKRL